MVQHKVLKRLQTRGRGWVFTPKDCLDLGNRAAIDQALLRLMRKKMLQRLARGVYHYPQQHPVLGPLSPNVDHLAAALARDSDSDLQVSGPKALHLLGLTTQVPAQIVYLTSGRSRCISVGNTTVTLKHASPKIMAGAGQMAGVVLQAIRYLGQDHLQPAVIQKITQQLSARDKKNLLKLARFAPDWARPVVTAMTKQD